MTTNTVHMGIARTASIIAGLSLVAFSLAPLQSAQAQTVATSAQMQAQINALIAQIAALQARINANGGTTSPGVSVVSTRDLTLGSTGTDVTALQNRLISSGYAIPAGATGYFGAQTQAALARYQAANGIVPAAGYFGVITRAQVNAVAVVVPPADQDEDEDEEEDDRDDRDREDAEDAIDDARANLDDAWDEFDEAEDDREDTGDALDLLNDANRMLDDAEDALDDEDYDDAMDWAEEAEDLIDEALDEIDSNRDGGSGDLNNSSVRSNNGTGYFEFVLDLEAFGNDEIELDANDFEYTIDAPSGASYTVGKNLEAENSVEEDNGTFYLDDESGEFTFIVYVFIDDNADSGLYAVTLESIDFGDGSTTVDETLRTAISK